MLFPFCAFYSIPNDHLQLKGAWNSFVHKEAAIRVSAWRKAEFGLSPSFIVALLSIIKYLWRWHFVLRYSKVQGLKTYKPYLRTFVNYKTHQTCACVGLMPVELTLKRHWMTVVSILVLKRITWPIEKIEMNLTSSFCSNTLQSGMWGNVTERSFKTLVILLIYLSI